MQLRFRQRIFLGLVALGTAPLAIALVVLAVQVRSTSSSAGPRAALDEIASSSGDLVASLDTIELPDTTRSLLDRHAETVARGTNLARRAETLSRTAAGALALVILVVTGILLAVSLHLAGRWSGQFSAPIYELVRWAQLIKARSPLPAAEEGTGSPEFDKLRAAFRDMSLALERARTQELEAERLVAFREVARRVAHEIRGPLTSMRLAVGQLRVGPKANQSLEAAKEVITEELRRLEVMAREFSEFGRLPDGPDAPVDVVELLRGVIQATVPEDVPLKSEIASGLVIQGHHEPLRRAIQNLLRNAIDATDERGITVLAHREELSGRPLVRLLVGDHGAGVPDDKREKIFQPYFTTKQFGTGLGLAIVKQAVDAHQGTIVVESPPEGGANFILELPEAV